MAIQKREQNCVIIIEPYGKIVGPKVSELQNTLLTEVNAFDVPRILINLEHTTAMSSSGLGLLMQAYTITKRKGGRIGIIHAGKHIKNLLILSRLSSLFEHFEAEVEAIEALSSELRKRL